MAEEKKCKCCGKKMPAACVRSICGFDRDIVIADRVMTVPAGALVHLDGYGR